MILRYTLASQDTDGEEELEKNPEVNYQCMNIVNNNQVLSCE